MRRRVRRNWHAWADIGAGRRVVDMIRNGVRVPFKSGPPAPFNQGVSMEDATPYQLRFMDDELRHEFRDLTRLRHLARPGDYMLFMDLQNGFYAVGIAPEDRDYFTVNYRGKL
eukprot:jgi/Tetstr1/456604/TSEL_043307.t1